MSFAFSGLLLLLVSGLLLLWAIWTARRLLGRAIRRFLERHK
jgi:hypothetical protein